MTIIHVDHDLTTGNNDNTSWANAVQKIESGLQAAVAGDIIYLKGTTWDYNTAGTYNISSGEYTSKPVVILGVKVATTNFGGSIVQSDLIPGHATGDAAKAWEQTGANSPPIIKNNHATGDIAFNKGLSIYGVRFESGRDLDFVSHSVYFYEECFFDYSKTDANGDWNMRASSSSQIDVRHWKCGFAASASGKHIIPSNGTLIEFNDPDFDMNFNQPIFPLNYSGHMLIYGGDFSDLTNMTNLVLSSSLSGGVIEVVGNRLASGDSVALSVTGNGRIISVITGVNPGTPLAAGDSNQDYDVNRWNGDISYETTAVRTNGSSDAASGVFSIAMTPHVNETMERYLPLRSEWIQGYVSGDGTSKTVTIYIANSDSGDYTDEEVWPEIQYPSEDGNTQLPWISGRAELLATASASANVVKDDTSSTWGTGAGNPQKLQMTIAPDYSGPIRVRINFAKAFAASPKTLFYDGKLDIS